MLGIIHQNCSFLNLWPGEAIFFFVTITLIFIETSSGYFCFLREEHKLQQGPNDTQDWSYSCCTLSIGCVQP